MFRTFDQDEAHDPVIAAPAVVVDAPPERAGYGQCLLCGCGSFYNDGTGDCRCGHEFASHY